MSAAVANDPGRSPSAAALTYPRPGLAPSYPGVGAHRCHLRRARALHETADQSGWWSRIFRRPLGCTFSISAGPGGTTDASLVSAAPHFQPPLVVFFLAEPTRLRPYPSRTAPIVAARSRTAAGAACSRAMATGAGGSSSSRSSSSSFNLTWWTSATVASVVRRREEGVVADQPVGVPFADTRIFHMVMQVLASITTENSTAAVATPTAPTPHATTASFLLAVLNDTTTEDGGSTTLSDIGEGIGVSLIVIFGTLLAVITIVGNLMVMVSFKIDRQLQTISNYFLLSLAVADITIGIISIPLMTYYTALNEWSLGYMMCQFWLCVDYLMSNASVLNLLLISFDRYFSVTRPLTYRPRRTTRKALIMIASTYIISLILWPPWIISWPYIEGKFTVATDTCVVQFLETNPYVTVGTAIAAFYLPVTIMIILYTRVYWETQKRQKQFGKLQAFQQRSGKKDGVTKDGASGSSTGSNKNSSISVGRHAMLNLIRKSANRNQTTSASANGGGAGGGGGGRSRFRSGGSHDKSLAANLHMLINRCTGRRIGQDTQTSVTAATDDNEDSLTSDMHVRETTPLRNLEETSLASSDGLPIRSSIRTHQRPQSDQQREKLNHQLSVDSKMRKRPSAGQAVQLSKGSLRPDRPSNSYTVHIELDGSNSSNSNRPSVRLICDSDEKQSFIDDDETTTSTSTMGQEEEEMAQRERTVATESTIRQLNELHNSVADSRNKKKCAVAITPVNSKSAIGRQPSTVLASDAKKAEKARRKQRGSDRKQESKAAKTLSAILFAFIITWTPYNLIVCWEAFFPKTFSSTLFTISYYLCYINSTVNPLCYALCNARFRLTYMRIIKCRWKNDRRQTSMSSAAFRNR
uniref:G-protein coupled receptors family 1 profile domain-containing protein n=1 Tax=Plectus sambesii TaxID=2011161 RepID=A0A914X0H4_9BILA